MPAYFSLWHLTADNFEPKEGGGVVLSCCCWRWGRAKGEQWLKAEVRLPSWRRLLCLSFSRVMIASLGVWVESAHKLESSLQIDILLLPPSLESHVWGMMDAMGSFTNWIKAVDWKQREISFFYTVLCISWSGTRDVCPPFSDSVVYQASSHFHNHSCFTLTRGNC